MAIEYKVESSNGDITFVPVEDIGDLGIPVGQTITKDPPLFIEAELAVYDYTDTGPDDGVVSITAV